MNPFHFSHSSRVRRYGASLVLVAALLTVGAGNALADSWLTLPAADPVLAFVAPNPDQPNYAARLQVFLQTTVPDEWKGQAVQFQSTYNDLGGVDVLGLPTSEPKADPNNPHFVYQRFENGVLFYNGTDDTTQILDS